ncbi:MAG: hypothetical protein ACT6RL_05000 [Neoaquamicrobium sediminum]|uniref:hypothetical protein n=1 Tax=Neoaquamicrobium sediminum TaxID=1849104 RepID=UPI004035CA9B
MMLSEAFGLPDHDLVPTEIASRFDTPQKADAHAADIVEWCRWGALPPAERGEAAREWWCASQGDHADAARVYLAALPAEQRAAMVSSWLKELSSYAGNCLWLAWRWHSGPENETDAPIRPSLLVATAAVLGLVAGWDANGRPVPARAIREILGLPKYNDLPAFLAAARMDADAARRGKAMTDPELAALVNVTGMTIGKWRPDFDHFAKSAPNHFFPLGLEGLPGDAPVSLEQIRAECAAVEEALSAARQDRAKGGERRKRQTRALKVEPRMALFKVAVQLARHDLSVPATFLRALATALGMNSSTNGRPLIAPDVLKGLGIPAVKDVGLFREAARRDGEALRDHITAMVLEDGRTFAAAWGDARDDKVQSGSLRDWFFTMVSRKLDGGWLNGGAALQPLTLARNIEMDDNGRNTVRDDWRPLSEYRRLVHTAATVKIMTEAIWRGQQP